MKEGGRYGDEKRGRENIPGNPPSLFLSQITVSVRSPFPDEEGDGDGEGA